MIRTGGAYLKLDNVTAHCCPFRVSEMATSPASAEKGALHAMLRSVGCLPTVPFTTVELKRQRGHVAPSVGTPTMTTRVPPSTGPIGG